jgi:hypothetical protein
MKFQKLVIIIIGTLAVIYASRVNAQSVKFIDLYLEPDTIRSGNYKNHEAYDLGHMVLYKKIEKANKFQIMDKSTNIELFSFNNTIHKTNFKKPKFFQNDDGSKQPTILMVDVSDIFSYGVHIFLIEDSQFHHSGFLDFAADNYNFSSLSLYSHFERIDGKLILTFDDIDLIDHAEEELVKGGNLKFEIQEDSIKRLLDLD